MINKPTKLAVRLRGGFSDRNKIKEENRVYQYKEFDDRTRTAIINAVEVILDCISKKISYGFDSEMQSFCKRILSNVYAQEVKWSDNYDCRKVMEIVYDTIRSDDYDSVLTVVEYLAKNLHKIAYEVEDFTKLFNDLFESEYVGYRFVKENIVPITNDIELESINEAITSPYKKVNKHLDKALDYLSDRTAPDYENSIKESISSVEAMCSIILGKSSTLADALKKLEKMGLSIHPSMKSAFDKLYGYTSDASGIRHAGQLDGKSATFEEAKFMLVSSCAFVNYLISVYAKYSTK